jgi:hypothetical protein
MVDCSIDYFMAMVKLSLPTLLMLDKEALDGFSLMVTANEVEVEVWFSPLFR